MTSDNSRRAVGDWGHIVAVALVAQDFNPDSIARYARVSRIDVERALDIARGQGVIDAHGVADSAAAALLIADLPAESISAIHASVARYLFTAGPDRLHDAIHHAKSVSTAEDYEEMAALADHGGRLNLSISNYVAARDLLDLAAHLDMSDDIRRRGNRLLRLAEAHDGLGDMKTAREILATATALGDLAGDSRLVARAASRYSIPVGWNAGDQRATALLHIAQRHDLTPEDRAMVTAARALAEMRIPIDVVDNQQFAWVTRAEIARPLADDALAASEGMANESRLLALLAWRNSHRAPAFAATSRAIAAEAMDLAQQLRFPPMQVESATFLAVDALQAADRALFDKALAVARWVADRDKNPVLLWRSFTLAAGAAHLDGDIALARQLAQQASEVGSSVDSPGWWSAFRFFVAQEVISADSPDLLKTLALDESDQGVTSPIAMAGVAYAHARLGNPELATRMALRSFRQLDEEASYLFQCTRLTAASLVLGDHDLLVQLQERLAPWADMVAVDGNAWWCDGPVSLWIGLIQQALGDEQGALASLEEAEPVARRINDIRSLARCSKLRSLLDPSAVPPSSPVALTDREIAVLSFMSEGATNSNIAEALSYSLSTIRDDTVSIYRKLDVKGRAEAVAKAVSLGLLSSR